MGEGKKKREYDDNDKLFNNIRGLHVNSLACVEVKWGTSESFRINSKVRQGYVVSPLLFNL